MPGISMCTGTDCPLKENCYRYAAKPSEHWQAWILSVPYNAETGDCEYQLPLKGADDADRA